MSNINEKLQALKSKEQEAIDYCNTKLSAKGVTEQATSVVDIGNKIESIQSEDTGVGSRQWWLDCYNGRTDYQNAFFRFTGETIPQIDTSNSSDFSGTFGYSKIKYLPELDYSNGKNFPSMCIYCGDLHTIYGFINLQNATNVGSMFSSCIRLKEIRFISGTIKISISFFHSPLLSDESIQSIIDGLAVVTTTQTITFNSVVSNKLTAEQISQITEKGWVIQWLQNKI